MDDRPDAADRPPEYPLLTPFQPHGDVNLAAEDVSEHVQQPRVAFRVPNTLTVEGQLNVDITFESMDDFSPAAVARKVDALSKLLEARTQLSNLVTYMDGKTGAEELIGNVLRDPSLLKTLASVPKPADGAQPAADARPRSCYEVGAPSLP